MASVSSGFFARSNTVKETLAQLRSVTKVQDAPEGYAKAVTDFGTAQTELLKAHFDALGAVAKQAQGDAAELLQTTGQQVAEQGTKAAASKAAKAA